MGLFEGPLSSCPHPQRAEPVLLGSQHDHSHGHGVSGYGSSEVAENSSVLPPRGPPWEWGRQAFGNSVLPCFLSVSHFYEGTSISELEGPQQECVCPNALPAHEQGRGGGGLRSFSLELPRWVQIFRWADSKPWTGGALAGPRGLPPCCWPRSLSLSVHLWGRGGLLGGRGAGPCDLRRAWEHLSDLNVPSSQQEDGKSVVTWVGLWRGPSGQGCCWRGPNDGGLPLPNPPPSFPVSISLVSLWPTGCRAPHVSCSRTQPLGRARLPARCPRAWGCSASAVSCSLRPVSGVTSESRFESQHPCWCAFSAPASGATSGNDGPSVLVLWLYLPARRGHSRHTATQSVHPPPRTAHVVPLPLSLAKPVLYAQCCAPCGHFTFQGPLKGSQREGSELRGDGVSFLSPLGWPVLPCPAGVGLPTVLHITQLTLPQEGPGS